MEEGQFLGGRSFLDSVAQGEGKETQIRVLIPAQEE